MSTTSYNVDYNYSNDNIMNQQPMREISSPIEQLRKRAYVNKADTELYDVRKWVNSVSQLYQQGEHAFLNNDLEKAYVSYMRGCSIMVEIVQTHSQFQNIYKDPIYLNLTKKTNSEIFPLLEELAIRIDSWYKLSRQQSPALNNGSTVSISNNGVHQNARFNVNPINHVASYAFRPSHDPRNYPHYSLNDVPINTNQITSPSSLLYPPSSNSSASLTPQTNMKVNNLAHSLSNQLKVSDKSNIPLPTWTNNVFPNTLVVESLVLANWITAKHNPPSILLIDARPRDIFMNSCIKHQWIIEIEPSVLSYSDQMSTILEALTHNPQSEQVLFYEIAKFDLVVYYDQNSKDLETASVPLVNLRGMLDNAQLKTRAMMLAGGFDAWCSTIGERGVYKFSSAKDRKHWFKSSSSTGTSVSTHSSHEHNSLYDYFTGKVHHHQASVMPQHQYNSISKPQPLPTAPRKESMTTRYHETLSPSIEKTISFPSQVPNHAIQQQTQQAQDLRPVPPSYPKLHRRRTFIDNPFNGFTATSSSLYDVPPIAYHSEKSNSQSSGAVANMAPIQQRPSSAEPSVSASRPSGLAEFHHLSASNIHVDTTSNFSDLGSVVSIGTTGLKNLGNTCYMNSIVQCLSGTVPLARYFTSGLYKQYINRYNKQGTGGALTESFAELIRQIWSENYNFISPMTFRDALARFAPQFSGTNQQDSQEFLVYLLDGLHEDMNQNSSNQAVPSVDEAEFEKLPDWQASLISWDKYLSKNKSIIVSLFQGQYRSRLTCLSCKSTSTTYNAFMSLSLPIPVKKMRISSVTLYQCLDYFVKEEVLEKEDAWKCPKCQKKRKASKQLTLTRLPDILLIHLKRFSADGLFRNKIDATVKCPTRSLDLSGYVPTSVTPSAKDRPSFVYDLYAVSNHYGTLSGGHYTACVRDKYKDKWNYFDDSKVSLCDENKVVSRAAYNLFYVRSKVK